MAPHLALNISQRKKKKKRRRRAAKKESQVSLPKGPGTPQFRKTLITGSTFWKVAFNA